MASSRRFNSVETFNINISHEGEPVTLTVIPENEYFKIVYFEGILGAIKNDGSDWKLLQEGEFEPGYFAPFDYKLTNHHEKKITLGMAEINQIGGEIENHLSQDL